MATASLRAPKPKGSVTTLTVTDAETEVEFRADVTSKGGGPTPTGRVTFKDGGTVLAVVQLGGSFSSTTAPATVTATYSGDAQYSPSTSETWTG